MRLTTGSITSLARVLLHPQISVAAALICALVVCAAISGQGRDTKTKPSADMKEKETRQRLREHGWWPTRGDAARQEYAGSEACAACHTSESASQAATS